MWGRISICDGVSTEDQISEELYASEEIAMLKQLQACKK
jgi:hypothetical protein